MSSRHRFIAGKRRHMHGWRRGHHEPHVALLPYSLHPLPDAIDLRTTAPQCMPDIRDQGDIGSCTAHAGVEAMGFMHRRIFGGDDPFFSALDLYAATRTLEGTPLNEDSGAQVVSMYRALGVHGVCLSSLWPYDTSKFNVQPPDTAEVEAKHHLAIMIYACPSLPVIMNSLATGYPVGFGFDCFESLESEGVARTGKVPYPEHTEQSIGGHCVLAVGYDSDGVIFQNSWGGNWGDGGFGHLPNGYFTTGLASDGHSFRVESK